MDQVFPKPNQRYKVLIRCATYNHEKYIEDALKGFVMQQTKFPFCAVVIDDFSTDGTADIIRKYEKKYPDIIKGIYLQENYYSQKKPRTFLKPWENSAEYLALCEGDDYWTDPLKLQKQVDALDEHPECTIAFSKVQCVNRNKIILNSTIPRKNYFKTGFVTIDDFLRYQYGKGFWIFQTSSYLARLKFYSEVQDFEYYKIFPFSDDSFVVSYLLNGKGYYINEICSCYRVQSGGHTSHVKNDSSFAVSSQKKVIVSLPILDEYTEGKYHNYIKRRQLRTEFYIDYFQHNVLKILSPKYWKIYSGLPRKTFGIIFLGIVCPRLHRWLREKRNNMKE